MDDGADLVFSKDLPQQVAIPHIALIELHGLAGQLPDTVQALGVGIAQVVDDNDAVAAFQQLHAGMGTDISGTAGHKNIHIAYLQIIMRTCGSQRPWPQTVLPYR